MPSVPAPDLADELFASRFELAALASSLVAGTSERWVEGFVPLTTSRPHRRRYAYAATLAAGRRVLDISCGAGCGSHALAAAGATRVVGLDLDPDAIRYARLRYHHERCTFLRADAETWRAPEPFDLVVSFETIEHLRQPEAMLATLRSALAPTGEGLISTPVALRDGDRPTNPHHLHEWTVPTFVAMLGQAGFAVRRTWFQGVRQPPGLAGRIRREVGRLLGTAAGRAGPIGDDLLESLAPYLWRGLRPKFQVHLIEPSA